MSKNLMSYLQREHARLENLIDQEARRRLPDQVTIARLKKLKLAVKDQISEMERELTPQIAA